MKNRVFGTNGEPVKSTEDSRYRPTAKKEGALDAEAYATRILRRHRCSSKDSIRNSFKSLGKERKRWNGSVWKPIDFERYCEEIIRLIPAGSRKARAVKDVLDMMHFLTQANPDETKWQPAIRFKGDAINVSMENGVVNIRLADGRISLRDADPKDLVVGQLPIEYDPMATCETFDYVLKSALPNYEDRRLLQCFVGYCLIPDHRFQCVLFCYGPPNSGKSLLIYHGIGGMFGRDMTSNVSLEKICKGGDELRKLESSLINIATEIDSRNLEDSSIFNQIACGEPLDVALKYQKASRLIPNAKHFFIANHIMVWKRGSRAEERRIRVLYFPDDFSKEAKDGRLEKQIATEGAGIFNWALRGLTEVLALDQMPLGGNESQLHAEQFSMNNDPIGSFNRMFGRINKDARILVDDYRSLFRWWCDENNITQSFKEPTRILRKLNPQIKCGRIKLHGETKRILLGIGLNEKGKELMRKKGDT